MVMILQKLTTLKVFYRKTKIGSLVHGQPVQIDGLYWHNFLDKFPHLGLTFDSQENSTSRCISNT